MYCSMHVMYVCICYICGCNRRVARMDKCEGSTNNTLDREPGLGHYVNSCFFGSCDKNNSVTKTKSPIIFTERLKASRDVMTVDRYGGQ